MKQHDDNPLHDDDMKVRTQFELLGTMFRALCGLPIATATPRGQAITSVMIPTIQCAICGDVMQQIQADWPRTVTAECFRCKRVETVCVTQTVSAGRSSVW